jgi:tetratricopeptide (TPR) repeat protein
LAARWISLGGLKSALEIYERLQMWAEIALCYAGLDMDEKARSLIRAQLFMPPEDTGKGDEDADAIRSGRQERNILPPDAPRLFCILGDIEKDPKWYDRAWDVSGRRYPRAQRALGRYFFAKRDYAKSVEAYEKSLKVSRLDHATWFAVGSAKLQLADWPGAVDAFFPAVQLDDQDAESWSNLAAALLKRGSNAAERRATGSTTMADADEDADLDNTTAPEDPYRAEKDALKAFKRAASLRYEDWRLWENVLTVAGSMRPPAISDVIFALKRIMEIRGQSIGEKSVDEDILDRVVRHVITSHPDAAGEQRRVAQTGIQQALLDLVENNVVPLITKSRRLWQIVARVYMWLGRPASALDASEKAWRALTLSSGWESASEEQWNEVVDGTLELADAYETYGQMERTDDLGAGQGRLVASDWRFKARNAVRSIMGRGRQAWEDSSGWVRLAERQDELKRRSP